MTVYYAALIVSTAIALFLTSERMEDKLYFPGCVSVWRVALPMLPLFLVALFRWNVGVDVVYGTGYYYQEYTAIQDDLGNILGYEPGFYALMELCNALNLNLYLFYCVVTCLFFGLVILYIAQNSENQVLSIVLFFVSDLYLFSFSTLRQALAIAFFLYPAAEICKGKNVLKSWKCWLSAAIAVSMHTSILYLLPIMLAAKIRVRKKTLLVLVASACVLSPVLRRVAAWLMTFTVYFEKYFGTNEFVLEFAPTYFALAVLLFIPAWIYYDELVEKKRSSYILINVAAIAVVVMANSSVLVMPYRIFQLFVPFYLILCPAILECSAKRGKKRWLMAGYLILPFILIFVNQYYRHGGWELFSYKSIFDHMEQLK